MVIFWVHKTTSVTRLMAQNQNGQTLIGATGQFSTILHSNLFDLTLF